MLADSTLFERDEVKELVRERRQIRMIRSFMDKSSQYREPHLELAKKSRELYETWRASARSMIQRANLKLPFGFTIIETQVPQLMEIFVKDEQILTFEGQDAEDAQWEHLVTDFHVHQFEEMDFVAKFPAFIKSMLIDGTAVAKVPYRYQEVMVSKKQSMQDPETGEIIRTTTSRPEVVYDGPAFEQIPIYDFFPDWSVKTPGDVKSMRGCVHRTFKTLASLRSVGIYKNLDEVEVSLKSKGSNAGEVPYFHQDSFKEDFQRLNSNKEEGIKDEGKVEIWEYWGLFDPNGDGKFEEYLITIANGDVVIRSEVNFYDYKFKPFVACINFVRDNEFYGIPELAAVKGLIKEANVLRNARLDNVNLSVNPMWIVDRNGGVNLKSIFSRPNGIILANDVNALQPIKMQDPSLGSRDEMAFIQQDIQNATALVNSAPIVSQLGKQFGRSATGVNFIQSFASSRIGLKARLLSNLFLKRLGWIMLMTNRQFVTEDKWIRVSDPNAPYAFEQLPADAFHRRFDLLIKTDLETGGPEVQFQKMQTVAQILQIIEQAQPGRTDFEVLGNELLRPILGRKVPRFFRTDQEMLQLQAQGLAASQAANAQVGQAAPQPNATLAAMNTLGLPES